MRDLIKKVKLLNGNLINLVYHIDAWCVHSVSFNDINEIVSCGIASELNSSVGNLVFVANRLDCVFVKFGHLNIL